MNAIQSQRLNGLRLVLNGLVVVLHAWAASQYVPEPHSVPVQWGVADWLSNYFSVSLLPVLFYVSGYLFSITYDGSRQTAMRKLKSRLRSLAVPYLTWNATFIATYLLLAPFFARLNTRVRTYELHTAWGCLNSLLGITRPPIDGPLWFVRNLFLMMLLAPALDASIARAGKAVLLTLGIIMFWNPELNPQWHPYCLFYFACGMYMAKFSTRGIAEFDRYARYIIPGFLMASVLFYGFDGWHASIRYVYYLGAVPFWLSFSRWMALAPGGTLTRTVLPAAFFIYAGHFFFCSILLHLLAPRLPPTDYLLPLLYLLFVIPGGCLCLAVYWILQRISPRLCALYSGGRG